MRALLFLLLASLALAAGARDLDATPASILAASCSSCHAGTSTRLPTLENLDRTRIAEALRAFRSGTREGTLMQRIARGYTDEEVELLAEALGRP